MFRFSTFPIDRKKFFTCTSIPPALLEAFEGSFLEVLAFALKFRHELRPLQRRHIHIVEVFLAKLNPGIEFCPQWEREPTWCFPQI